MACFSAVYARCQSGIWIEEGGSVPSCHLYHRPACQLVNGRFPFLIQITGRSGRTLVFTRLPARNIVAATWSQHSQISADGCAASGSDCTVMQLRRPPISAHRLCIQAGPQMALLCSILVMRSSESYSMNWKYRESHHRSSPPPSRCLGCVILPLTSTSSSSSKPMISDSFSLVPASRFCLIWFLFSDSAFPGLFFPESTLCILPGSAKSKNLEDKSCPSWEVFSPVYNLSHWKA